MVFPVHEMEFTLKMRKITKDSVIAFMQYSLDLTHLRFYVNGGSCLVPSVLGSLGSDIEIK
ncbi:hypothetical protein SLEP1_g17647 [Rubroshorea leprosula]|uniref:Uncharacterized protein n=1 Tax=Rubroshorea leprosula TaxID=152421 RepID=A0AAV5IUY9_9ROSI|nr:hypothetical protein SLEP1_g17647 [Rubroshorea leprosula]